MCSHDSLGSNNNRGQLGSSHARGPVGGWLAPEGLWRALGGQGGEGGPVSQLKGEGLRRGNMGVICYTPLSPPPPISSGPTESLSKLHPRSTHLSPPCGPTLVQAVMVSPWDHSGFLTGSMWPAWPPTLRSPHTARKIFPKRKSHHSPA